jgi:DNA-binding MarR family transcriptional regulator
MGRKKVISQEPSTKGFALWQLSNQWQRGINTELKSYDLTHVQYIILEGLINLGDFYETVNQKSLANYINANAMMVSKVLRFLEEKGYVERKDHEVDTRALNVSITKSGRSLYKKVSKHVNVYDDQFFASLGTKLSSFIKAVESLNEETAV